MRDYPSHELGSQTEHESKLSLCRYLQSQHNHLPQALAALTPAMMIYTLDCESRKPFPPHVASVECSIPVTCQVTNSPSNRR